MKKILSLALSIASIGFMASSSEAKTTESITSSTTIAANANEPQWRTQDRWGRRNNRNRWERTNHRGVRVVTQSRIVRIGRQVYRETYQIRYSPNGRTQTRLINRVRIR